MDNLPIWCKVESPPQFVAPKPRIIKKKTLMDELFESPKDCGCNKKKKKKTL